MSETPDYLPVVTRLPEALQEEAEAIAEAERERERLEAEKAAQARLAANQAENERAAEEEKSYAEDTERLHRESQ
jgi:hypothetical protein